MTLARQITYLLSLMKVIPVSRCHHGKYEDPSKSRWQNTLEFMLPDTAALFERVCQKMFMEITF